MKKVFRGTVSKGNLVMSSDYTNYLFTLEDQDIDLTICKHKKNRSLPQNSYFHGVILEMISDKTGYEIEEVKEILRGQFLSHEIKIGDEIFKVGRSTASLSTVEFEEFNSQCRRWASITEGVELYIPEPNKIVLDN